MCTIIIRANTPIKFTKLTTKNPATVITSHWGLIERDLTIKTKEINSPEIVNTSYRGCMNPNKRPGYIDAQEGMIVFSERHGDFWYQIAIDSDIYHGTASPEKITARMKEATFAKPKGHIINNRLDNKNCLDMEDMIYLCEGEYIKSSESWF